MCRCNQVMCTLGRGLLYSCVIVLVGWLSMTERVLAADIVEDTVSLKQLRVNTTTLHGYNAMLDIWFPGSAPYVLDKTGLVLNYDASPLVEGSATLIILLNDLPVTIVPIVPPSDRDSSTGRSLHVALPVGRLRRDYNHIILRFHVIPPGENCVDPEDPSRYLVIYDSSAIVYTYHRPLTPIGQDPPCSTI